MEEKLAGNNGRQGGRRNKRNGWKKNRNPNGKGGNQSKDDHDDSGVGGTLKDTLERIHRASNLVDVIPYNRPIERVISSIKLIQEIEGQERTKRAKVLSEWIVRLKEKLDNLQTDLPEDFDDIEAIDPDAADEIIKQVEENEKMYDKLMDKLNSAHEKLDAVNKAFKDSFVKRIAPIDLPFFKDDLMANRLEEVLESFKARYLVVDRDASTNAMNILRQWRKDPGHSMEKHLSIFFNLATAKASLEGTTQASEVELISDILRSLKGSPYGGLAEAMKNSKILYPDIASVCEALYEKERELLREKDSRALALQFVAAMSGSKGGRGNNNSINNDKEKKDESSEQPSRDSESHNTTDKKNGGGKSNNGRKDQRDGDRKPSVCWVCGDQDHRARNCPKKKESHRVVVLCQPVANDVQKAIPTPSSKGEVTKAIIADLEKQEKEARPDAEVSSSQSFLVHTSTCYKDPMDRINAIIENNCSSEDNMHSRLPPVSPPIMYVPGRNTRLANESTDPAVKAEKEVTKISSETKNVPMRKDIVSRLSRSVQERIRVAREKIAVATTKADNDLNNDTEEGMQAPSSYPAGVGEPVGEKNIIPKKIESKRTDSLIRNAGLSTYLLSKKDEPTESSSSTDLVARRGDSGKPTVGKDQNSQGVEGDRMISINAIHSLARNPENARSIMAKSNNAKKNEQVQLKRPTSEVISKFEAKWKTQMMSLEERIRTPPPPEAEHEESVKYNEKSLSSEDIEKENDIADAFDNDEQVINDGEPNQSPINSISDYMTLLPDEDLLLHKEGDLLDTYPDGIEPSLEINDPWIESTSSKKKKRGTGSSTKGKRGSSSNLSSPEDHEAVAQPSPVLCRKSARLVKAPLKLDPSMIKGKFYGERRLSSERNPPKKMDNNIDDRNIPSEHDKVENTDVVKDGDNIDEDNIVKHMSEAHMIYSSKANPLKGTILDSGASDTMFNSAEGLDSFTKVAPGKNVFVGGVYKKPIIGYGNHGNLKGVLIVPGIQKGLIATTPLMRDGCDVFMAGNKAYVYKREYGDSPPILSATIWPEDQLLHMDEKACGPNAAELLQQLYGKFYSKKTKYSKSSRRRQKESYCFRMTTSSDEDTSVRSNKFIDGRTVRFELPTDESLVRTATSGGYLSDSSLESIADDTKKKIVDNPDEQVQGLSALTEEVIEQSQPDEEKVAEVDNEVANDDQVIIRNGEVVEKGDATRIPHQVVSVDQNNNEKLFIPGGFGTMITITKKQFKHGAAVNRFEDSMNLLSPYERLHFALGHVSHRAMLSLAKHKSCIGLGYDIEEVKRMRPSACIACWIGKSRKLPAPPSFFAKPVKVYWKLWFDIKGPFKTTSVMGHKYFLLVLDGYSSYKWIFFMKTKDESVDVLRTFVTKHINDVHILASDSDVIFKAGQFRKWIQYHTSIEVQFTAPYRHEGPIEAGMKVIMDGVITAIHASGCPEKYWDFVAGGVVHTHVRVPNTTHPNTTPYYMIHGKLPDVSHLVPLGAPCVFMNYKEERKAGGLDARGIAGRVIGYSEETPGAYIVAAKQGGAIKIRKDVRVEWNAMARNDVNLPETLKKQLEQSMLLQSRDGTLLDEEWSNKYPVDDMDVDYRALLPRVVIAPDKAAGNEGAAANPSTNNSKLPSVEDTDDVSKSEDESNKSEDSSSSSEVEQSEEDSSREEEVMGNVNILPKRFSRRLRRAAQRFSKTFNILSPPVMFQLPEAPKDFNRAVNKSNPFRYWWIKATIKEIRAIAEMDTYVESPDIPEDVPKKAMKTMLVYRVTRRNSDEAISNYILSLAAYIVRSITNGEKDAKQLTKEELLAIEAVFKFKARWVVKGCSAIFGIHYDKTFSPTIHFRSLLILLHLQLVLEWVKSNIDIGNAYINAMVKKFILMLLPLQLTNGQKVLVQLKRNLYGMKDAGLLWYELMNKFLVEELGFIRSMHDACVYLLFDKENHIKLQGIVALYVDDLQIGGNTLEIVNWIKQMARDKFGNITDFGTLTSYLGIEIVDVEDENGIIHSAMISQDQMLDSMQRDMEEVSPDVVKETKGRKKKVPTGFGSNFDPDKEEDSSVVLQPILDVVGKFNYLANRSRIDTKHHCSVLAAKATAAPPSYVQAAKELERYLQETRDLKLKLGGRDKKVNLFGYADASHKKTSRGAINYAGYCLFLGKDSGAVSSQCTKIKVSCSSSTEAEIRALHECMKEVIWIRGLLEEIGFVQVEPTLIFQDNISTIRLCSRDGSESLSKHVMPLLAAIRESIKRKEIRLEHCRTEWMVADMLTSTQTKGKELAVMRTILMEGHVAGKRMAEDFNMDMKEFPLRIEE